MPSCDGKNMSQCAPVTSRQLIARDHRRGKPWLAGLSGKRVRGEAREILGLLSEILLVDPH